MVKPNKSKAKPTAEADESFPFIVSNGPGRVKDPALRTLIRKQAMKDVGLARKRKGNYGLVNLSQPAPVFEDPNDPNGAAVASNSTGSFPSSSSSASPTETPDTWYFETEINDTIGFYDTSSWTMVPMDYAAPSYALPSPTGYTLARSRFSIDLTKLSMLTNFNVSKSTIPVLTSCPTRLASLMDQQQWSYLEFVPQMYDSSACLAAATDCVLAKARDVLFPDCSADRKGQVLKLYAKAISRLQAAITDVDGCTSPDVLCAIQLMSLHELLDPSRAGAYSHHVQGSARLVRHRSAARFTSEFEKALFAGHVGPLVSEALIEGTHCYLDQPEWIALYTRLALESDFLTNRHPLVIKTRVFMFIVPGVWCDVEEAVKGDALFDDAALLELQGRCRKLQSDFLSWLEDYKAYCVRTSLTSPTLTELGLRREVFGATVECLIIIKRLLAAVCEAERLRLESEVQALAVLILDLQKGPSPKYSWLFSTHEVGVAHMAQISKENWEEDVSQCSVEGKRLATRRRYLLWAGGLRNS